MTLTVEIQRIANAALLAADSLLADWLPDGTRKGKEYWPTNPVRADRQPGSFSINLHSGTWHDFASGDKGGDLVSLLAYLRNCRQLDAARIIAGHLGLPFGGRQSKRDMLAEEIERQRIARQREERQQKTKAEQQAGWARTTARALHQWGKAVPADSDHPYIVRKGIKPHHLRQLGDVLLVPVCWRGAVVNLQRINADGGKRFMSGGKVVGCYSPFGRIKSGGDLHIVEGVATAATLYEQTGKPVAAALSAQNLLSVGFELKRRYPAAVLIIGGDDDRAKEAEGKPNVGKLAAIHAAATLGCGYVLPAWPEDAPLHLSDFNDLRKWQGGGV